VDTHAAASVTRSFAPSQGWRPRPYLSIEDAPRAAQRQVPRCAGRRKASRRCPVGRAAASSSSGWTRAPPRSWRGKGNRRAPRPASPRRSCCGPFATPMGTESCFCWLVTTRVNGRARAISRSKSSWPSVASEARAEDRAQPERDLDSREWAGKPHLQDPPDPGCGTGREDRPRAQLNAAPAGQVEMLAAKPSQESSPLLSRESADFPNVVTVSAPSCP
jgi:hypothetical protein